LTKGQLWIFFPLDWIAAPLGARAMKRVVLIHVHKNYLVRVKKSMRPVVWAAGG